MRSKLVILLLCVAAIALGAYLLTQREAKTAEPNAFNVLAEGTNVVSPIHKTNYRLTTSDDFVALWNMIYGTKTAPPAVDFSKNEVLAVFDGEHSSDGYRVAVADIQDVGGMRTVVIAHTAPDAACKLAKATTTPFQLVLVSKSDHALAHTDTTATTPCN